MVVMIVFTMMALGLNIVVGYAGLLDLGYVAFYAVGAYTAGWFASQQFEQVTFHFGAVGCRQDPTRSGIHISMWLVLIVAGLLTLLAGIVIGLPTLRLRGDYLAIVTLGFGEIIPQVVRNGDSFGGFDLTHGTFGIAPIDPVGFGAAERARAARELPDRRTTASAWYYLDRVRAAAHHGLLLASGCATPASAAPGSRSARTRPPPPRWAIPLMRTKTWAYAIGAFFGGVAGAYYASFKAGAFPADFYFNISVFLLCMVILGGMGSVWGVIVGGMILGYLNVEGLATIGSKIQQDAGLDFDPTKYQFGIYGIIIVLMMLFRPAGLIPERRHKIEIEEGVHDTPFYDVQTEGTLTDRNPTRRLMAADNLIEVDEAAQGVRRPRRHGRRRLHDPARLDRRADRAERRRQDDVLQPAHGRLQADLGLDRVRRDRGRPTCRRTRSPRSGIGRTFQNIRLFAQMTAVENVLVGMHCRLHGGILGSILRTAAGASARKRRRATRARELLVYCGLPRRHEEQAGTCPTATSAGSRSRARSRPTRSCSCSTSRRPG